MGPPGWYGLEISDIPKLPILPNSPDLADALETAVVAAASMAEPVTRASRRLESARIVHAARGVVTTGRPDESAVREVVSESMGESNRN